MQYTEILLEVGKQYFTEISGYRTHLDLFTIEDYFRHHHDQPDQFSHILTFPQFRGSVKTKHYHYAKDDYTNLIVGFKIIRCYSIPTYKEGSVAAHKRFFDVCLTCPVFKKAYQERRIIKMLTTDDLNDLFSNQFHSVKFIVKEPM